VNPIPTIVAFHPSVCSSRGGSVTQFWIHAPEHYSIRKAFCRFGPISVSSHFTNRTVIFCISPPIRAGVLPVGVSFDGYLWSKDNLTIQFVRSGFRFRLIVEIGILICLLICTFGGLFYVFRAESEMPLPENRWTLHRGTIVMSNEQGVLSFLFNMMFRCM
jgi:hypothetical protein